jgi:Zn-finger nucleic acid-binding protein
MTARTRDSIEVDICGQCGGVWLDKGELAKIIDAERARGDEDLRANWRMYDRGRDTYEPATKTDRPQGTMESLLGD